MTLGLVSYSFSIVIVLTFGRQSDNESNKNLDSRIKENREVPKGNNNKGNKIVEQSSSTKKKRKNNQRDKENSIMSNSSSKSKSKSNNKSDNKLNPNTDKKSNKRKRLKDDDSDSSYDEPNRKKYKKDNNEIVNIDENTSKDGNGIDTNIEDFIYNKYNLRDSKKKENDGELFIKYGIYNITIKELRLLKGDWLNDVLIDFFFYYFLKNSKLDDLCKEKIFVFSCISSKFLFENTDYEKLKKWLKSSYDILVFPIILKYVYIYYF